jgi:hypothetical protein
MLKRNYSLAYCELVNTMLTRIELATHAARHHMRAREFDLLEKQLVEIEHTIRRITP